MNAAELPTKPKFYRRQLFWILVIAILSLLFTAYMSFARVRVYQTLAANTFLSARAKWREHHPQQYRVTIQHLGENGKFLCEQRVLARFDGYGQDNDFDTEENTCMGSGSVKGVGGWFEYVSGFFIPRGSAPVCGSSGCFCDGVYIVDGVYDDDLGYPHSLDVRLMRDPLLDLTSGKLGKNECSATSSITWHIKMTGFELAA